ncbi:MAG: T9SS type A sorting domain-containing protein, partial [Ferruginibacter sp.]
NPVVNGDLRFVITGLPVDKKATASVIDFNGRMVAQKLIATITDNSINLKNVSAGMYKLVVTIDGVTMQQTFMK